MKCSRCHKKLSGRLDTFGDMDKPKCWTCYSRTLDVRWDGKPRFDPFQFYRWNRCTDNYQVEKIKTVKATLSQWLIGFCRRSENLFRGIAERFDNGRYWAEERYWHSQMPPNVRIGEIGLQNYYCPFCDTPLDYRIDFDGILNGVCWSCQRTWYETWENSDCPDFQNMRWPTKRNVLPWEPSSFWSDGLNHCFKRQDGLSVDQGEAKVPAYHPKGQ
jgi:hypothetical protein